MFKRILTLFKARNLEFMRDRSAVAWNILFPILVIVGFSLIFSDERQILYKVGIVGPRTAVSPASEAQLNSFIKTKYIDFIRFRSVPEAMPKLLHHRIDLLINTGTGTFWNSKTSPKGYIAERLLKASAVTPVAGFSKESVTGVEVPYIEWLFPGILGMNIMFSALFGVGYVVVTYRKNGVLKRLSVTPLRPWEFLTAQILSRMYLLLVTTAIVFVGCAIIYGFQVRGSYLTLFLVFCLGGFSMISLSLVVAARSSSEEFAGGILNLITWPMMFLSEVWFSLEGAHPWVLKVSRFFPLTQMIDAARKIMNDGAGLREVQSQLFILALMSLIFLITGSKLFTWHKQ
ncbi:MAG: ABC transporter permease [Spirochaetes bacterium RBG_13_51_14]|nr:MAG: ABC transporter permease [Spirochaetes bacterium RBG_13_51_14]